MGIFERLFSRLFRRQGHVTTYVRKDGTRVRSHTRSAQWARARSAWAAAAFGTVTALAILVEAGVTLISTIAVLLIAVLTTITVLALAHAEQNKKTMSQQQARRTRTQRTRSTARTRRTTRSRNRR